MSKKIFIMAGEPSGDLQGSFVIRELKKLIDEDIIISGMGGDLCKEQGVELVCNSMSSMSFVGPWHALGKIPFLIKCWYTIKRKLFECNPDLVLMIDSPAWNMRMGKVAKKAGFKTVYFFPPSAWCKSEKRLKSIVSACDYVIPVFSSNVETYKQFNLPHYYFGHPIVDIVKEKLDSCDDNITPNDKTVIAFLPGSRKQEIDSLMNIFIKTMKMLLDKRDDLFFIIPASSEKNKSLIESYFKKAVTIPYKIVTGGSYKAFKNARATVTASGTATLEAAIAGVPMTVVYRLAWPDYCLGKLLGIKVDFFAAPNLVVQRKIVPELLQDEVNPERLTIETLKLLDDTPERKQMLSDLNEVKNNLGELGAVKRIAKFISEIL